MPCLIADVDSIPVVLAAASFKDLVTVDQENSTNQTADGLVEDQLQFPLGLSYIFPGAWVIRSPYISIHIVTQSNSLRASLIASP